jgi:hypothetical protein
MFGGLVVGFGKRNLADAAPDLTAGPIGSGLAEIPQGLMHRLHRHFRRDVTYADVDNLHRQISARAPTHANRVLSCLSTTQLSTNLQAQSAN